MHIESGIAHVGYEPLPLGRPGPNLEAGTIVVDGINGLRKMSGLTRERAKRVNKLHTRFIYEVFQRSRSTISILEKARSKLANPVELSRVSDRVC